MPLETTEGRALLTAYRVPPSVDSMVVIDDGGTVVGMLVLVVVVVGQLAVRGRHANRKVSLSTRGRVPCGAVARMRKRVLPTARRFGFVTSTNAPRQDEPPPAVNTGSTCRPRTRTPSRVLGGTHAGRVESCWPVQIWTGILHAPSRIEYSEWTWRWTNGAGTERPS